MCAAWIGLGLRALLFVSFGLQGALVDIAESKQDIDVHSKNKYSDLSSVSARHHGGRWSLGFWGQWSNWSPCSKTLGRGISTQVRECLSGPPTRFRRSRHNAARHIGKSKPGRQHRSNRCIGVYKRFQVCNISPSGVTVDFRKEECASYNGRPFNGRFYVWEPYFKDVEDCELNCRPVGQQFFATFKKTVDDGTSCNRNPSSNRVCIAGKCKVN